eukprot:TRINITY_DN7110_c0_g1_i1.p1 TRINITY_DN7110_c0_g1~~TRINITY_DN7110_c0_g1_i1.p1  ORF type:complete len:574 (-),score=69.60 TRINITY_DN7110_c0_g1_i1:117-1838(-)
MQHYPARSPQEHARLMKQEGGELDGGSLMDMLPPETLLQIFCMLPVRDVLVASMCCRHWQVLANDPSVWRALSRTMSTQSWFELGCQGDDMQDSASSSGASGWSLDKCRMMLTLSKWRSTSRPATCCVSSDKDETETYLSRKTPLGTLITRSHLVVAEQTGEGTIFLFYTLTYTNGQRQHQLDEQCVVNSKPDAPDASGDKQQRQQYSGPLTIVTEVYRTKSKKPAVRLLYVDERVFMSIHEDEFKVWRYDGTLVKSIGLSQAVSYPSLGRNLRVATIPSSAKGQEVVFTIKEQLGSVNLITGAITVTDTQYDGPHTCAIYPIITPVDATGETNACKYILVGYYGAVKLYERDSLKELLCLKPPKKDWVYHIVADETHVAVAMDSPDIFVYTWDLKTGTMPDTECSILAAHPGDGAIELLKKKDHVVVAGTLQGIINLWNIKTREHLYRIQASHSAIHQLHLHPFFALIIGQTNEDLFVIDLLKYPLYDPDNEIPQPKPRVIAQQKQQKAHKDGHPDTQILAMDPHGRLLCSGLVGKRQLLLYDFGALHVTKRLAAKISSYLAVASDSRCLLQ